MSYKYYRSTFYHKGKQYNITGKTQKEADQKAAIRLDKLERGEIGINPNMTVKRWTNEWLSTYKKGNVGLGTYNDYERRCNIISDHIGDLRLIDVKDIHLQNILNTRQGNSVSDINKTMLTMKSLFKQAYLSRLITFDPSQALRAPQGTKGSRRSITDFEREHILKVAETHDAGPYIKTLLFAGLRTGEAIALQWKDVDFENNYINISKAYNRVSGNIKPPKTEAGIRKIPLMPELRETLFPIKGNSFDYVFTQATTGNSHTASSTYKLWKSFKKELDDSMGAVYGKKKAADGKMRKTKLVSVVDPELTPYYLRHTFCTDMQILGVPLKEASYIMGHSDINVTANIYTHVTGTMLDNVKDLMHIEPTTNNVKDNVK